mgnify:FL=1
MLIAHTEVIDKHSLSRVLADIVLNKMFKYGLLFLDDYSTTLSIDSFGMDYISM